MKRIIIVIIATILSFLIYQKVQKIETTIEYEYLEETYTDICLLNEQNKVETVSFIANELDIETLFKYLTINKNALPSKYASPIYPNASLLSYEITGNKLVLCVDESFLLGNLGNSILVLELNYQKLGYDLYRVDVIIDGKINTIIV